MGRSTTKSPAETATGGTARITIPGMVMAAAWAMWPEVASRRADDSKPERQRKRKSRGRNRDGEAGGDRLPHVGPQQAGDAPPGRTGRRQGAAAARAARRRRERRRRTPCTAGSAASGRAMAAPVDGALARAARQPQHRQREAEADRHLQQRQQPGAGEIDVEADGFVDRHLQRRGARPPAQHQHHGEAGEAEQEDERGQRRRLAA